MQDPLSVRPSGASSAAAPTRTSLRGKVALVTASLAISLFVLEIGFRIYAGMPLLSVADWRAERIAINRLGERAQIDPLLGWVLRSNNATEDHTTLDHGIRMNGGEKTIRTGAVLAVGDSFTEGWEVDDDESWPAYLERMIGTPVVNGGVGGYGTDQVILRVEQLLPIVRPKILIVGFLDYDIYRAAHSHFGAPKPYFTLDNGALTYHPPAPIEAPKRRSFVAGVGQNLRDVLGYFAVADFVLGRLAPNYWYGIDSQIFVRKVDIDAAAVTCALLDRVKKRTAADGIRMLLFMQHRATQVVSSDQPAADARRVMACARAAGIEVVDQFAQVRAIAVSKRDAIDDYYFHYEDNTYGHMTAKGNELAAQLLAKALGK